jgi:hypothetical protein
LGSVTRQQLVGRRGQAVGEPGILATADQRGDQTGGDLGGGAAAIGDITNAAKAVAAAMLEHAVSTRRPLRYGQVLAALGQTPPLVGSI